MNYQTTLKLLAASIVALSLTCCQPSESRLVILHTNDTHSHIDPDRECDLGGALRRKALIDSVRHTEKNVLLLDAGDAVQGSLYYTFFKGETETLVMNELKYDVATIGNHEFDNAMQSLAEQYRHLNAQVVSANYDMSRTPLDTLVTPFVIKEYVGKRVAVIGLNVNPDNLISERKCAGLKFSDPISTANRYASLLKDSLNADIVIALTHIGYSADSILARNSRNIDIIIGGHSHTIINPDNTPRDKYRIPNLDGKEVLITQTGYHGHNIGVITLNLDSKEVSSKLITLNSRLDARPDSMLANKLEPYKHIVDSLHSIVATHSADNLERAGEPIINFVSDFIHSRGEQLTGHKIDIAIMNRGGIRNSLPKGIISKGDLMMTFPFDNFITVIETSGDKINQALQRIAKGNRHSISHKSAVKFNPAKLYRLATIDYLADGNDGMEPLKGSKIIVKSDIDLKDDLIEFFNQPENKNFIIIPDSTSRVSRITNSTVTSK